MKTLTKILVISFILFGIGSRAQVTLQHSFTNNQNVGEWVYLEHSGYKYVALHADTLTFYNLNYSLFRKAIFPAWIDTTIFKIEYISEGLFDADTLHIDYLVTYTYPHSLPSVSGIMILKDNGNVVFREDTAVIYFVIRGMGEPMATPIFESDSGTFMIVEQDKPFSINNATQIYQLGGKFPCMPGCSNNNYFSSVPPLSNSSNGFMSVFPNPSTTYSNIYYTLPPGANEGELILYDLAGREVKKYTVTSQVDHLRLTTSDIAAGTYLYQLNVNGEGISTKKIVVVK